MNNYRERERRREKPGVSSVWIQRQRQRAMGHMYYMAPVAYYVAECILDRTGPIAKSIFLFLLIIM